MSIVYSPFASELLLVLNEALPPGAACERRARTGPSCPGDAHRAVAPAEAEAAVSAVRSERGLAARPSVRLVLGPRALGRGLARTGLAVSSVAGALGAGCEDRASSGFVPRLQRREPRPFRTRSADGRRRLKRRRGSWGFPVTSSCCRAQPGRRSVGCLKTTFPINFGFDKINKGLRAASAVLESHLTVLEKFQKSYLNVGRN